MIKPIDLMAHYGEEEFCRFSDAHLALACERAESTALRYLGCLPEAHSQIGRAVQQVVLTIARAYAHDEQEFGRDHPIVRELDEAIAWLKAMKSSGQDLCAPPAQKEALPARLHGTRVDAPRIVFDQCMFDRML